MSNVGVVPPSPIDLVHSDVDTADVNPNGAIMDTSVTFTGDESEVRMRTKKHGLTDPAFEGTTYHEEGVQAQYVVVKTWDS